VPDVALLMNVISGRDPKDSTSVDRPVPDYLANLDKPLKGPAHRHRQGISAGRGMDPQVKSAVDAAIKQYQEMGAKIVDVSLPHTEYGIAAYYVIAPCEASSNLARYDGVHFGHRTQRAGQGHHRAVQQIPRRRIRRRSAAPNHDRHLRPLRGLLRCLLPAGPENAGADQARFRSGV
jgi:Asp-tRNA(Asn)/Glu-tRNA(Gln) amidotransferase A subunit family amidase